MSGTSRDNRIVQRVPPGHTIAQRLSKPPQQDAMPGQKPSTLPRVALSWLPCSPLCQEGGAGRRSVRCAGPEGAAFGVVAELDDGHDVKDPVDASVPSLSGGRSMVRSPANEPTSSRRSPTVTRTSTSSAISLWRHASSETGPAVVAGLGALICRRALDRAHTGGRRQRTMTARLPPIAARASLSGSRPRRVAPTGQSVVAASTGDVFGGEAPPGCQPKDCGVSKAGKYPAS